MHIGYLIKQRRRQRGYSQVVLAAKANISLPTIQNLEAGKANPTLDILRRLEKSLAISVEIQSQEPDWGYLVQFGLPYVIHSAVSKKKPFSYNQYAAEILRAVNYIKKSDEGRLKEALAALLFALQQHYPTYFEYCLSSHSVHSFLKKIPSSGRLIKLKRIALAKISKVI